MIKEFLKKEKETIDAILDEYFDNLLKNENELLIRDFIEHLKQFSTNKKAKRIHPVLLIAAFSGIINPMYLEEKIDHVRETSIAIELLHEGHLIHDDLIDEDNSRRGAATFHVQLENEMEQIYKGQDLEQKEKIKLLYGRDLSILGGSLGYLLGLDVLKASKFSNETKLLAINEYSEALNKLIRGQIIEEYMEDHKIIMSMEQYLDIAEMQKARIFEKAVNIGAILAGGNIHYQVEPLSEAMLKIGQAYAIRDDILDIKEDILRQKKKFLYIVAIQNTDEGQSKILNEIYNKPEPLNKNDLKEVENIFKQTNAPLIAEHFSQNLIEQAKKNLSEIYPDLNKKYKVFFNEFSDYVFKREF
ncbi:MAG: polyprenyl synthetase family protein [Promethearchaeota archaeon]